MLCDPVTYDADAFQVRAAASCCSTSSASGSAWPCVTVGVIGWVRFSICTRFSVGVVLELLAAPLVVGGAEAGFEEQPVGER